MDQAVRLIHTADLHLGTELYGHTDSTTGLSTRMTDFTRALDRVVDYAIAEDVDLFLFAGDAYKTRDPNSTYRREFDRRARREGEGSRASAEAERRVVRDRRRARVTGD